MPIRTTIPPTRTRIEIVAARDGAATRLVRLAGGGLLRPRALSPEGDVSRVALVQTAASLLAGDAIVVDVRCGPGARLRLVDVAALIAHHGRGGEPATLELRLDAAAGARLEWDAQPLVLAAGSRVRRITEVTLGRGAAALLRDTLVLGRSGEPAGHLASRSDVRLDGRPLHADALDTGDVGLLRSPVVLGGAKVLDTLALYGVRAHDPRAFPLARDGALRQELAPSTAAAARALGPAPARWRAMLLDADPASARRVEHRRSPLAAR